ncbi:RagB/SusD family nutrient uptake outer membrane protein [Fulvivirga sp. M361]|uniref:RagB/SusD family nutrient uptake outer membrane protein n=1 Tax=Fulvivirga sp. M361 TaxID=2594266 RepID=UPI001179A3BB|nr:RagB/SusD family nutrient uptake outer membrane protein [Fulvivirga sp. M361]TRX60044.1 RagB/SusD family nutrient uptake outer membrane protein [Fulvivirga sp. M361]
MKKYLILALAGVLSFTSCTDQLEVTPDSFKGVVGTTLLDAQESVNGAYVFLRNPYGKYAFASIGFSILEVPTGTMKPAAGTQDTGMEQAYALTFDDNNNNAFVLWQAYFDGIEAANIAIASIPNISDPDLTDELASSLLGQAYFLRAYYYFQLVQIFGDIPLKTTPSSSLSDGKLPKSSVQEIYEQVIVPDLQQAEAAGLPSTSAEGRVTLGAVKSLLAKVYLTMAGSPLNQTDKYTLAAEKALEVINSGAFSLFQDGGGFRWVDKLREPDFDLTEEHIFMAQFATAIPSSFSQYFTPIGGVEISAQTLHFGGMEPEEDFYNSYDPSDVRGQNQGFFFDSFDGVSFNLSVYKYFDETFRNQAQGLGTKSFPLLRYADVLLIYAEAQNESGTANTQAYTALNSIRGRAGLSDVAGLSQNDFREEVWRQRAWEFPAEGGYVWFDMKRTMKVFNGTGFDDFVGATLPNGNTLGSDNIYFPIPAGDVLLNPALGDG